MKESVVLKIWEEGTIIDEYYRNDNYYCISQKSKTKKYLICFSGNGIYFPNTVEVFHEIIDRKDRYEWQNIVKGSSKFREFEKIIFVRDIYKTWYVKGINEKVNTIDKLVDMLRNICCDAKEIYTLGNSAGGYIATLVGSMLKADAVYNFSGQYDITYNIERNPFWRAYKEICGDKYQNICSLIVNSGVPIFYFYPGKCENDIIQYNKVKNISNVYSFAFDEVNHGATMLPLNYQYIITMDRERLKKECYRYQNKMINSKWFMIETAGFFHTVVDWFKFKVGQSNFNKNVNL